MAFCSKLIDFFLCRTTNTSISHAFLMRTYHIRLSHRTVSNPIITSIITNHNVVVVVVAATPTTQCEWWIFVCIREVRTQKMSYIKNLNNNSGQNDVYTYIYMITYFGLRDGHIFLKYWQVFSFHAITNESIIVQWSRCTLMIWFIRFSTEFRCSGPTHHRLMPFDFLWIINWRLEINVSLRLLYTYCFDSCSRILSHTNCMLWWWWWWWWCCTEATACSLMLSDLFIIFFLKWKLQYSIDAESQ